MKISIINQIQKNHKQMVLLKSLDYLDHLEQSEDSIEKPGKIEVKTEGELDKDNVI